MIIWNSFFLVQVSSVIPKEMCQTLKLHHTNKWYIYKPEVVLENERHNFLWNFEIQININGSLTQPKRPNLVLSIKNERTCYIVDVAMPGDHRVEVKKKREKPDKYLDLARELKKLWTIKVTMILAVVGALLTVPKNLEKRLNEMEIWGRTATTQSTALLKLVRILRRILETWETCCFSDFSEKPSVRVGEKNLQGET